MGIPAQDNSPRKTTERTQMATDEIVSVPFSLVIDYRKIGLFINFLGDGAFQETNAKVVVPATFR
jgi:hypothetical protein